MVERMLQYLYNNDVGSYGDLSTTGRPFLRCAQLYAIGDKYDISGLKRFAMRRFKTFAEIKQKFGGDFVEAIKKIYNSTPEQDYGLRDVAAEVAQGKIHRLRNNEGFVAVLKEIPDFALGLLNAMIEEEEGQHCVCCKHNSPSEALYCMFCRASFAQMEESVRAILS